MHGEGKRKLTSKMIADVEKVRHGFEMDSRVGVTQLGRSTKWREDLERLGSMEVVDRNQTAAVLLKPDVFEALMKYIDQLDSDLEQAQVESIFDQRRDTSTFLSGEGLAAEAKENYRSSKENIREFLDDDK